MGRSQRSTEFFKECMADALIRLMRDKPPEKISVQEITDTAGVGRATWFRNYSAKSEAVTFKLVQLWNRYASEHGLVERSQYTLDNAEDFFRFNSEIRHIHAVIYAANWQAVVYEAFYQVVLPLSAATAQERYQKRFYCYGLFGLLDEWIKRDYLETPEEMTRIVRQLLA